MDKMDMHTKNIADENYAVLAKLFPNAVTETITGYDEDGKAIVERAIDADVLQQEISATVVEGKDERYQFTWPDKKKAIATANTSINSTLRPDKKESSYFEETENLYIEGDNLEVLKLLQETYLERIKMIYIDPPYNTGNDFVYDDDYSETIDEYFENSGQLDEYGNRLIKNIETNGRFHTDWLNMMYSRLKISRNLLKDDGVIFISVDDYEDENMKKICNEIFGEKNFIAQLIWQRAFSPKNDARFVSNSHDYVLMFVKNKEMFKIGRLPRTEEANSRYTNIDNDPRGAWTSGDLSVKTYNASTDYPITTPSGRIVEPPSGRCWRMSKDGFDKLVAENRIYFGEDGNNAPRIKRFLSELKFDGMAPTSIMFHKEVGHSQEGSQEVSKLLDAGVFDGPKPVRLMKRLLTLANLGDEEIVLDYFSGSASTAHAVMEMNVENNRKLKYIMVQIPQDTAEKSEAKNEGFENICQIGKRRIKKAAEKISEEIATKFDGGFRVLKLDSSNMKDVYYNPTKIKQQSLFDSTDNIKEDRTPEDLLFQVMLDLGVMLSEKIEETIIADKKVFNVGNGFLLACFDKDVSDETVKEIAKLKPIYAVFRDNCMANDSVANNFDQIFESYSPQTVRKVL